MILLLLFLNYSWAEMPKGCTSPENRLVYDLRSQFGEIKDQGNVGWCYAYPTADLLNHKLARYNNYYNKPVAPEISARAIALSNISLRAEKTGQKIGDAFLADQSLNEISRRISANMNRAQSLQRPLELLKDAPTQDVLMGKIEKLKANSGNKSAVAYLEKILKAKREYGSYESVLSELKALEKDRKSEFAKQAEIATKIGINAKAIDGGNQVDSLELALNGKSCSSNLNSRGTCFSSDMCTEADIPSGNISYRKTKSARATQYYKEVGALSDGALLQELYQFQKHAEDSAQVCRSAMMAHLLSPNQSISSFQEIFAKQSDNDPIKFVLATCKNRGVMYPTDFKDSFKIEYIGVDFKKPDLKTEVNNIITAVDSQIENKEPVAISINPDILFFNSDNYQHHFDKNGSPQGHAVTVVGKRQLCKTGEEEYIIRNSWGKDACDKHVKAMGSGAPYRCENGYFIVSKSHLKKGVYAATVLKDIFRDKR